MAQTAGLRATSFAASAVLMGLVVLGALSVSVQLTRHELTGPSIDIVTERPEDPPKPPPIVRQAPPREQVEDQTPTTVAVADPLPASINDFFGPVGVPEGPPEITDPRWLQRPRDLASYYPRRAEERGVTGEVVLDCLVSSAGRLHCDVASETPANWGFAEAALRISRDHRMAPAMRNGVAVQGRYRMRVPFEVR